ncbi:MAG: TonB-dependent receptor [Pedobacter sp.]|nr:MAG: TonB-dependent receptor [Pedobacter sp.]
MRRIRSLLILIIVGNYCIAQDRTDSTKKIDEVQIKAPFIKGAFLRAPVSVGSIGTSELSDHTPFNLHNAVNTIAGVRMEERSPGSYRLSVRGSLLRSPFGIRNIKVYIDEFSLTDAGGNTYLNLIDPGAVKNIAILKGPAASIFGANTGGAVLIGLDGGVEKGSLSLASGSYGTFKEQGSLNIGDKDLGLQIFQAYQYADGYRRQSALNRMYIHAAPSWKYHHKGILKALLLYSDLSYETPGGLTEAQVGLAPRQARPGNAVVPGAVEQKAGIFNESLFTGLSNIFNFNDKWSNVTSVQYLHTNFRNPFITNYEIRDESSGGFRSYFTFDEPSTNIPLKIDLGIESSTTKTIVNNYQNNKGVKGNLLVNDHLAAQQWFIFTRLQASLTPKLFLEASSSINNYGFSYRTEVPALTPENNKELKVQIMPAFSASYLISKKIALRASIGRGYSPPTIAEIRASDNQINASLEAEHGYNYEAGIRFSGGRVTLDGTFYNFNLHDAIVRKVNTNDTEYFINAGGTNQRGIELQAGYWLIRDLSTGFLTTLHLTGSYAYSDHTFDDYIVGQQNLKGNRLTGVPDHTITLGTEITFQRTFRLFIQYNSTSAIWLNDLNTVIAKRYHLAEAKFRAPILKRGMLNLEIFCAAENIFNAKYSAGNDLNAANGRYFNPAAGTSFYGGIEMKF